MKQIAATQTDEERRRWKVVRLDNCLPLPGEIVSADEATGDVTMRQKSPEDPSKTVDIKYAFGPKAIAIVTR